MPTRLTLLALIALLCCSCGFKHEPTGPLAAYPQTVRDALGHEVRIDTAPRRIVSLDPGMTAAMYTLGAQKLLVGRSGGETYPKKALRLPVMAANGKPNTKAIIKAGPDVVLVPLSMAPTVADVDALQRKIAAVVYVVDGSSVAGVETDISELGLITDHASAGRRLAAQIQGSVANIEKAVAGRPPARAFVDLGFSYTIDPTGITGDMLRLGGGQNVASEVDPSKPVTVAQLSSLAPDVYISRAQQGATLAELKKHKGTANLPAVTQGRVVQLSGSWLSEDGPRIAAALAQIAKALHPDAAIPQ
jgi:iron complex transport system substrate-binding protein